MPSPAAREREIMVCPFRPQSPPRAGRHRSSSPGRGRAAPPVICPGHPRGCAAPARGARHVPALGIGSITRSPVSPRTLSSCPGSGHGPADKAGPGSGSSSPGERCRGWGWGITGCRLLEPGGERLRGRQRGVGISGTIPRSHPRDSRQLNPPPFPSCCLLSPSVPSSHR